MVVLGGNTEHLIAGLQVAGVRRPEGLDDTRSVRELRGGGDTFQVESSFELDPAIRDAADVLELANLGLLAPIEHHELDEIGRGLIVVRRAQRGAA
jgi:hypothetical protein